jgi:hypothetical protein
MGGVYSIYGEVRNVYKFVVGEPEGEILFWR